MILIYPPAARPSEPPAGLGKLSGALGLHGIPHRLLDANLEGLLYLLQSSGRRHLDSADTWTRRAARGLAKNLALVRDLSTYRAPDRYDRAVRDLNRLIEGSSDGTGAVPGLANYQHRDLLPVRSRDLIRAAETFEENPFYPYFRDRIHGLMKEGQPSVVGFSLNYLSQALCTFAMAGFLRKHYPAVQIVLGGGLVTSWVNGLRERGPVPADLFRGLIDHVVSGPGEDRLISLAGRELRRGQCTAPDYDLLPKDEYLSPGFVLPYSASSGCYWNRCSFCPERAEGNPYLPLPVHKVNASLGELVQRSGPLLIHLLDNAVSPALMESFIANPPGAAWYGFARFTRHFADREFCVGLRRSGCAMIKLGLESGDQGVLDRLDKGIDLGTVSSALKNLKEAGIGTYVYLLFGTPAETVTEARKTLDFVARHSTEIDFLNLALFNMPSASPDAAKADTASFYEGDLSLYSDFRHPGGWDRARVRQFLEHEFKRHPAVVPILRRDPAFFTSNHAPFFVRENRA